MVSIVPLPLCPPPSDATLSLASYGMDLTGPQGGPTQRVLRLGSRLRAELSWSPMAYDDARLFISRMTRAEGSPVSIEVPQRGLKPISPGATTANSGGTSGLLPIRGGTAGAKLREGQIFSLQSAGRRWVHILNSDITLDGSGAATLPISPLLRVLPAAGDPLEWMHPLIEGFLDLNSVSWTLEMLIRVGLKAALTEDR